MENKVTSNTQTNKSMGGSNETVPLQKPGDQRHINITASHREKKRTKTEEERDDLDNMIE